MADAKKTDVRQAIAPLPTMRKMSVIAQDPTLRAKKDGPIVMAALSVPAEILMRGPIGYRVQVVDYDATKQRFNGVQTLPNRFEEEPTAWKNGAPSILDDYRFHAQNVYALVMKTLWRFEYALGRRISWKFGAHQIKIAPHGMLDANAFYSPNHEGLVFGYFKGASGKNVYACLSHDVVVHETTHALIDALHERYMDPSSPDQAAFHEGFADVISLLSVFSQQELVRKLLSGSNNTYRSSPKLIDRKDVSVESLRKSTLFGLADQMGEEMSGIRGDVLRRSTEIKPDPKILAQPEFHEAHRRGEILVAAVLNGFIQAWTDRIQNLGIDSQERFSVARIAEEGADIADALVTMWIRALDYMPPVHVEFSDVLSAALTADFEVRPDDSRFQLRKKMLKSFQSFGIQPASNNPQGAWDPAPTGLNYDRVRFESMRTDKDEVFHFIWDNFDRLELCPGAYTEVLSVRPCKRTGLDGFVLHETVAEYYQVIRLTPEEIRNKKIELPEEYHVELRRQRELNRRKAASEEAEIQPDDSEATTPLYGGGTLIFDEYGKLKYHIHNNVLAKERQTERLRYLWDAGLLELGKDQARLRSTRLSTIHRLRAIDARRFPAEGW